MEESRVMSKQTEKEKITFDLNSFDFIPKMRVGDKGYMDLEGIISIIRQGTEDIERVFKIHKAKLNKMARSK